MSKIVFALFALLAVPAVAIAQAPARGAQPPQPAAAPKADSTLLQLMRGVLYPASNVVFAAQSDLGRFPKAADPAVSPNPITSTYGGWTAVENAALALVETAPLVLKPGRVCSNGVPVPVRRADWVKYVADLRTAGLAAYKAAQSKNTDAMVDAGGTLADACENCHSANREKGTTADRCK